MRTLVMIALVISACGDNLSTQDAGIDAAVADADAMTDPTLVTVEILGGCPGLLSCSHEVRIDGVVVALHDAVGSGPVPVGGGPVQRHVESCSSPTSCTETTKVVADARRGDTIRFGGDTVALPADCVCRDIASPVVDGTGVHWTDPRLANVDARFVSIATGVVPVPPFRYVGHVQVDGERSTDYAYPGIPTDATVDVWVLECSTTSYDALRTEAMRYAGC